MAWSAILSSCLNISCWALIGICNKSPIKVNQHDQTEPLFFWLMARLSHCSVPAGQSLWALKIHSYDLGIRQPSLVFKGNVKSIYPVSEKRCHYYCVQRWIFFFSLDFLCFCIIFAFLAPFIWLKISRLQSINYYLLFVNEKKQFNHEIQTHIQYLPHAVMIWFRELITTFEAVVQLALCGRNKSLFTVFIDSVTVSATVPFDRKISFIQK